MTIEDINGTMYQIQRMKHRELVNVFQVNRANQCEHWMHFANYSKKNKRELRDMLVNIYFDGVPIYLPMPPNLPRN